MSLGKGHLRTIHACKKEVLKMNKGLCGEPREELDEKGQHQRAQYALKKGTPSSSPVGQVYQEI